ncbi:MAG: KamA family radical SAM protein [Planctomycetota bacterium]|jgi:lysine 2,3-aminomutase
MSDWQEQLRNSVTTAEQLEQYVNLTPEERAGIERIEGVFNWGISPYFASLMDPDDPDCPVRRQVVPRIQELQDELGVWDPLKEEDHSPVENLIHVYPDRVAFCVSSICATFCRFCLRKRVVDTRGSAIGEGNLAEGLDYIRSHSAIRDVLLTGGDPLLMSDERIEDIVARIHEIPHVQLVRIGSRTPCTLPSRITDELCRRLARHQPFWINTHFNHPKELTPEAVAACGRIVDAGIPMGNQSVLLKGVNDDTAVLKELGERLVAARVRPYYLYQCQTLKGTAHLRVQIERGVQLVRALRGQTSGFAIPQYVLDTPYGKVPLNYQYIKGREGDHVVLESFSGKIWREPNPVATTPERQPQPNRVSS